VKITMFNVRDIKQKIFGRVEGKKLKPKVSKNILFSFLTFNNIPVQKWRLEPAPLPPIVSGIESDLDWYFFDHFYRVVSNVLSVNPVVENLFHSKFI
jgi:hypothetical protein